MVKLDPLTTILYPVITENAIALIESENKLVFMVNRHSSKIAVKKAVEKLYEVTVDKVNLLITTQGEKKAFVKLSPENHAADTAIKLGIL
ncbi:MAG: 50S ribosomal protein L23 [Candidatus Bathyarchaeota archaeon]